MEATSEQIIALTKLQHIDLERVRLNRELDELPQKQQILDVRNKQAVIQQKLEAIEGMRKDAETKLAHAQGEDADIERRQSLAQSLMSQADQDYRMVSAHAKELDGFAERREVLAEEILGLFAKLEQIQKLESEIAGMTAALAEKEQALIESYRKDGGEILRAISSFDAEREQLCQIVGEQILGQYERIAKSKQGVALAYLNENACNTCRSKFDSSRVLGLRQEAPLTICPQCGRLMVVDKRYNG